MRRKLFYLSVALLAFGIGSFVGFKFYRLAGEKQIIVKESQIANETANEKYVGKVFTAGEENHVIKLDNSVYVPKLRKATCSDKKLLPVWTQLRKDLEFQAQEKRGFYYEADCSKMLHIQETDLNDDGKQEIILSGNNSNLCDAAFSCSYWIFEKKGKIYKQILYANATGYNEIANYKKKEELKLAKQNQKVIKRLF